MPEENKPRAYTPEEVRTKLYEQMKVYAREWARDDYAPGYTLEQKMEGLCFSILGIFDGVTPDLPMMDLILVPHENDQKFQASNGENWFEPQMNLRGRYEMHDEFHNGVKE